MTIWDDLAARIRDASRHHARVESPPAMRFKVLQAAPLVLQHLGAHELVLEEGDPDFEIAHEVDAAGPAAGDVVVVHADGHHDYIATSVIKRGNSG